ncbi:hypothetical protein Q428_10685 [Fervidicella metallireducens AeB]|uniref:Uncharacterized protein n=1 Tax=Fervidicella metallireducens AeB TaxID=1403537 RepID=A0A017RTI1_9CLOT|nr:hypothetical protein [Fervidicella metallireducens]EYE87916.1 hypothetical protein Q428_10685 [Fervidicella metallireducens AeB]
MEKIQMIISLILFSIMTYGGIKMLSRHSLPMPVKKAEEQEPEEKLEGDKISEEEYKK